MHLNDKHFKIARVATNLVVGLSTYAVAKAVIKNNVAEPETVTDKVTLAAGSFVLANMVSGAASSYVDRSLTGFMDAIEKSADDESTATSINV